MIEFGVRSGLCFLRTSAMALAIAAMAQAAPLTFAGGTPSPFRLPSTRVPKWTKGGLLTVQLEDPKVPLIWKHGHGGLASIPVSIPGADSILIYDFDQDAEGTVAVSGSAVSGKTAAGFVAWISTDGARVDVIRTGGYRPAMVTIAPDGSIWTVGKEVSTEVSPPAIIPAAGAIRRVERTRGVTGSYIPQSSVPNPLLTLSGSRNTLRASRDRIAWYSVEGRYVEISFDGKVLTDIALPVPPGEAEAATFELSFALTEDGNAFLCVPYRSSTGADTTRTFALDRAARAWKPVTPRGETAGSSIGYLYGVDQSQRLATMGGGNTIQFYTIGQ